MSLGIFIESVAFLGHLLRVVQLDRVRRVAGGGVVGGDAANVLRHMELGLRLIAPPVFASDFALHGAVAAAAPFHEALSAFNSS